MRSGSSHSLGILSQAILCLILDAVSYYPTGLVTGGSHSATDLLVMESTPLLLSPLMVSDEMRNQLLFQLEQSQQRRWLGSDTAAAAADNRNETSVGRGNDGYRPPSSSLSLVILDGGAAPPSTTTTDLSLPHPRHSPRQQQQLWGTGEEEGEEEEDEEEGEEEASFGRANVSWASYPRRKRSVMGLYHMLQCTSSCNPLGYKGYGCYCGFLGSGTAVDGIDTCCLEHDQCYEEADTCVKKFSYYTVPYKWKCKGYPVCLPGRTARSARGSCSHQLCECDRRFAECIAHYPCPSNRAICISSAWRRWHNFAFGRTIRQFFRH